MGLVCFPNILLPPKSPLPVVALVFPNSPPDSVPVVWPNKFVAVLLPNRVEPVFYVNTEVKS